jgi:hypothetical protein
VCTVTEALATLITQLVLAVLAGNATRAKQLAVQAAALARVNAIEQAAKKRRKP